MSVQMANTKKETSQSRLSFNLCIIFTIAYVFATDFMNISPPLIVYAAIASVFMIFYDYETLIMQLMFFIPIARNIPYHMVYPVVFVLILFKSSGKFRLSQIVFPIVILFQEVLLWMFSPEMPAPTHMVGYAMVVLFIFLIPQDQRLIDYKKCINMYILGTFVLCATIVIDSLISGNFLLILAGEYRLGISDTMAYTNNLNNYAYYIIVAIACLLTYVINNIINHVGNLKQIIAIVILFFCGWFIGSRAYTICFLTMILLMLLYLSFNGNISKKYLLVFLILVSIGIIVMVSNQNLLSVIVDRFSSSSSTSNTRSSIFIYYWEWFKNSGLRKLFGAGALTYKSVVLGSSHNTYALHNATEQFIICYGIIGAIFFISGLLKTVSVCRNGMRIPLYFYLPLFILALFIQSIQFINPYELMMPFIVVCLVVRHCCQTVEIM